MNYKIIKIFTNNSIRSSRTAYGIIISVFITLLSSNIFSQPYYEFYKKLDVGKRPVEFFEINDNFTNPVWLVYCAGWDENSNGKLDVGDESPSIWYFSLETPIIGIKNPWWLTYEEPQKLIDLDFQNVQLPVRFGLIRKNSSTYSLFIPEPNGLSEIVITKTNKNPLKFEVEKNTILPLNVSAISCTNKNKNRKLFLSIRDEFNKKGSVIIYDLDNQVFLDTIESNPKVQMTYPIDSVLFILSEMHDSKNGGRIQEVKIFGELGDKKHILINDFSEPNSPVHLYPSYNKVKKIRELVVTCEVGYHVKIFDEKFNYNTLIIPQWAMDNPGNLKKAYQGYYNNEIYTTSYRGFINVGNDYRFESYGRAESIAFSQFVLVIATPYFENTYLPDSTIKLLTFEPVSVVDEITNSILLSPNPASDYIDINLSSVATTKTSEAKIINILGIEVGKSSLNANINRINISHLPIGVYYIIFGNRIEKFMKI
jgi:hypothetical protein